MLMKRCGLGFICEVQMEKDDRLYNLKICAKLLGKLLYLPSMQPELELSDQIKAVTSCSTHKIDQQETDG